MATPRTPNQKKQYAKLNVRLAKYGKLVEQLYDKFNREAAKIAMRTDYDPDAGKMFRFQDYPITREAIKDLLNEYVSDMTGTINRTTATEWENSNEFQDLVANKVLKAYGVQRKDGTEYERYYQTNSDHLKAFQNRTVNGMNLSRRVWNLKEQYKQELEMGLSVGIERGVSAASLAKQMKRYLNEPDKLFRRVRDKFGNLQLSKNAKAYHPGRGVYRSSFKNAMRLTRSETNMAYRTAEQTRWRQFDFVVGYEIKLSQSHPCHDVCDELAGKYPKDFVWTGWHPMDLCYCVSILKTQDEFWRDLGNEDNAAKSTNEVTDVPEAFKDWVKDNADRIESAEKRGTQPYFIRDNKEYIQGILKPAEAKKTPLEIAAERHAERTQEDIDRIKDAWTKNRENLKDTIANLQKECLDAYNLSKEAGWSSFSNLKKLATSSDYYALKTGLKQFDSVKDKIKADWEKIKGKLLSKSNSPSVVDIPFEDKVKRIRDEINKKEIKTIADVKRIFNEFFNQFPEEFNNKKIKFVTIDKPPVGGRYTMGHNIHNKEIAYNTHTYKSRPKSPFDYLLDALNKIRTDGVLTDKEHNALEVMCHELLHQKAGKHKALKPHYQRDYKRTAMETMNEYAARCTYKDFLRKLGASNTKGAEDMIRKGPGYQNWVNRLIGFIDKTTLNHETVGKEFAELLTTKSYSSMDKELYKFFKSNVKKKYFTQGMDEVLEALENPSEIDWKMLIKKWFQ